MKSMEQVFDMGDDNGRQDAQEHHDNKKLDEIPGYLPVFHVPVDL
jgi:hypothetical protein